MNKNVFVLCGLMFAVFSGSSQTVSVEEAMSAAQQFLGKNQKSAMYCAKVAEQRNDTLLYVFNADNAFVVVSATKQTIPVLAYSEEGVFDEQDIIPPVAMWLNHYQQQILAIKNRDENVNSRASNSWKQLLEGGKVQKSNTEEITPFLLSKWGQGKNYNYYCPKDDSSSYNGRAVTGCVATAMAQLIYYFRFPQSGAGNYSYQHPKYGKLSADFGAATYDYAAMCDVPSAPNAAISLLMHHCGVAVDMLYGHNSSGMYNHSAARALKNYFKFSPQTQYVFRDSTTMDWDSLIIWHLERKIPLYYAGWGVPNTDGHAFICDGYRKDEQENYYYHFNFGWDGQANGYFHTDTLFVGGSNFNLAQELIINAYPDTLKEIYPQPYDFVGVDTLTEEAGSFTDGSGIFNHNATNRDFTWVILPHADVIQSIRFSIDFQLVANDTLFIETDDPIRSNYVFTDTSASFSLNVNGKKIVVRVKTASGEENSGIFHASYASVYPIYCSFETKTQATGTLSDGSGNNKYNNMITCEKRIVPIGNYTSVRVHFTKFETEKDRDFLYIYDFSKKPKELLLTLSGTHTDTSYTFNTRTLSFIFETDARNVFGGWELVYTAGYVGMQDAENQNHEIKIYPNPTTGELRVTSYELQVSEIQICNVVGQILYQINKSTNNQINNEISIDISHLSAGIYILKVETEKGTCFRKLVKN